MSWFQWSPSSYSVASPLLFELPFLSNTWLEEEVLEAEETLWSRGCDEWNLGSSDNKGEATEYDEGDHCNHDIWE